MAPLSGRRQATLLILVSAICSQVGGTFAVRLFRYTSPVGAVWIRGLFGALFLWLLAARRGRPRAAAHWRWLLTLAAVITTTNLLFYEAISRLPLGDTVALEYLGPIAVAVAASQRRRELIWIGCAGLGVLAISQRSAGPLNPLGALFALMAGAGWSAYTLVGRRVARRGRRETSLALTFSMVAPVLLLPAWAASGSTLLSPRVWEYGALIGLLSTAIPYSVELLAMTKVSATAISVLLSLQPFMAGVAGLLLLGQALSWPELLGFFLITAAASGVALSEPAAEAIGASE